MLRTNIRLISLFSADSSRGALPLYRVIVCSQDIMQHLAATEPSRS